MELLTVKKYAELVNISVGGVYKQFENKLKNRKKIIDGLTYVDISGLDLDSKVESTEKNIEEENQDKSSNRAGLQEVIQVKEELIQNLKQQIATLQNQYQTQLSIKDETIAALQAQVQQMQHQINSLTQLLSQAQQLAISQQLAIVQRKPSFWSRFFKK